MPTPTVIITGASRGLGAAAARIAARLGAQVALTARSAQTLEKMAATIRGEGGAALAVPGDVREKEDCQKLVQETMNQYGRIDALVHNAGVIEPIAPVADADADALTHNLAVNLIGPMVLTQMALPHLRQSRGRVISVSSGAAVNAIPGWAAYCAAKAAINHFHRVLAVEEEDVTSLTFRPGVVDTEMQAVIRQDGADGMPASAHAKFLQYHARGDLLPPERPGRALAVIALHAPPEWSGRFMAWDDAQAAALVRQVAG